MPQGEYQLQSPRFAICVSSSPEVLRAGDAGEAYFAAKVTAGR